MFRFWKKRSNNVKSKKNYFLYGTGFSNHYHHLNNKGFYTNSKFEKVDEKSGYENKNVFMLRYEEYSVIKE